MGVLADLVLILHLAFIVFVVAGAFLVIRWPRMAWLHLPLAAWGVIVGWGNFTCPLTPLENYFRRRAGESGYGGGFIEHYLTAVIYPDGLTRTAQLVLGTIVLAINLALYWRLFRARRRQRAGAQASGK